MAVGALGEGGGGERVVKVRCAVLSESLQNASLVRRQLWLNLHYQLKKAHIQMFIRSSPTCSSVGIAV